MKIFKLSQEARAATGFTHAVRFKVTDGDMAVTAVSTNVMAIPVGSSVGKVAFHITTIWNKTTTLACGIAATASSATTFLNGVTIGTGGANGTTLGSAATTLTVNNTASRFITVTPTVTSGPATAGEAWLLIQLVDHAKLVSDPSSF